MNFNDLERELIDVIDTGIAVEIVSPPGRGKSEFMRQLARKLSDRDGFEWGYTELFLATYTPQDMMGFLMPDKLPSGERVSRFTTPAWMITDEGKHLNEYQRALVFMDEFGQGEADTKKAAANLLLNRRVGPHILHDGIAITAASNRSSDRSGVTKSFDFVINRRVEFHVTDDLSCWEGWAHENGISPLTVAFAKQNPQIVFSDGVPEKQGPWCTPRSLVMLDRIITKKRERHGDIEDKGPILETAAGIVGQGAAAQYFAFVRLEREMPKFERIIADPKGAKVPEKPDAQMLVTYHLAHKVDASNAAKVITYVDRLGKEFATTFVKAACGRNPALIETPAFSAWCAQNSSLVAAISR